MVSAAQAIEWHRKQMPYEDSTGTAIWMRGNPPHWPGSAFCGKTQEVCCYDLKLDIAPTTDARIVFVPHVVSDAKAANKWITSYQSNTGDWVIFDWLLSGRRDGYADHIGMVLRNDPSLPYIDTVEGNTTAASGTGQRGIFFRRRYRIDILGCVDRSGAYTKAATPVIIPTSHVPNDQDLNKWVDVVHIQALQTVLKVGVDGVAGKETYTALQKALGTTTDGILSAPASRAVAALQKKIGLTGSDVDGILGAITGKKLQEYLDAGGDFSTPVVKPTPAPTVNPVTPPVVIKPVTNPVAPNRVAPLKVDGYAGKATITAWQKYEGSTDDGVISGQDAGRKALLPVTYWPTIKWQAAGKADGSRLITTVQRRLNLKNPDGIVGPATAKAIQRWLGVTADGILGPKSVKALQTKLNGSRSV